jgi:sulfite reductase (NADPH) hemoprotein beta-component
VYRYDDFDHRFIDERVAQYRDQVRRRLAGQLTEEEFRPLRLMNGLYLQLHAYMLRIAIPYGMLSSTKLRKLAHITRKYDRGYGHFTTRTNLQLHWIKLEQTPDILAELASVEMHAIQTSGNSFRNTTTDPFAGVAADELEDPRPYAEIIRQWATLHPEFSYLPRKFKIAICASKEDRAAVKMHDLGLYLHKNEAGELGFEVVVGGGLGRTPYLAQSVKKFVPVRDVLSYIEACLRVYNRYGRRDNVWKARIKILVNSLGAAKYAEEVEQEWLASDREAIAIPETYIAEIAEAFAPPTYDSKPVDEAALQRDIASNRAFARWVKNNVHPHKVAGHAVVTISLKEVGKTGGDISAEQMDIVADLADEVSFGEVRVAYEQNLVLPHVRRDQLFTLWQRLDAAKLGTSNKDLVTDIICCPGLDYCGLATARSIPVAQRIAKHMAAKEDEIGTFNIKMSGCINACGHHHLGHIGILGVEKNGEEVYQITLGGDAGHNAAIGTIVGPAVRSDDVPAAVDTLIGVYMKLRQEGERFPETYRRVGQAPFKEALYAPR